MPLYELENVQGGVGGPVPRTPWAFSSGTGVWLDVQRLTNTLFRSLAAPYAVAGCHAKTVPALVVEASDRNVDLEAFQMEIEVILLIGCSYQLRMNHSAWSVATGLLFFSASFRPPLRQQ